MTSVLLVLCLRYRDQTESCEPHERVGLRYKGGSSADVIAGEQSPYRATPSLYLAGSSADMSSIATGVLCYAIGLH